MTKLLLICGAIFISDFSWAVTCEEDKQQRLATWRTECTGATCYPNSYCFSYDGLVFQKLPNSSSNGYLISCRYTITYPNQSPLVGFLDKGGISDCGNYSKVHINQLSKNQLSSKKVCGSIVGVESQTLGEAIPITGANFFLTYSTAFATGRTGEYAVESEIAGVVPRDYLTGFTYEVLDGTTSILNQTYANTPNQTFSFVWNGLDPSSNLVFGPRKFQVNRTEISPSGSFTYPMEVYLGTFNAKEIGLGGWLPSVYHFYSSSTNRLYGSDGSVRSVVGQPYGALRYVAEVDGSQVYFFDSSGRQVSTKSGFLGAQKYTFNHDAQGRLTSIDEPFGKTTHFNRNILGEFISITAPNGKVTSVSLDANGYLASVTNSNNETYVFVNSTDGLLTSFEKPGGQVSIFSYDVNGNLIQDSHSGGYFFNLVRSLTPDYPTDMSLVTPMGRVTRVYGSGSDSSVKRISNNPRGGTEEYQFSSTGATSQEVVVDRGVRYQRSFSSDPRFGGTAYSLSSITESFQNSGSPKSIDNSYNVVLANPTDPFSISSYAVTQVFNSIGSSAVSTVFEPVNRSFVSTTNSGNIQRLDIDSYERPTVFKLGNQDSIHFGYTSEYLTSISQGNRSTILAYN